MFFVNKPRKERLNRFPERKVEQIYFMSLCLSATGKDFQNIFML